MSDQRETHDMVVTRMIQAPRERVWRAWSDPDEVMTWWGPQGFTSPMCRMDFREGGTTLVAMRSDRGLGAGQLVDVSIDRADGPHRVRPRFRGRERKPGLAGGARVPPTIPDEVPHVVTFVAIDGATTELTVHESGYPDEQIVEVSRTGMEQVLDKLAAMLS